METATLEAPETVEVEREFSFHDRCDRCGFQAYIVAQRRKRKKDQELVFCGHHGREYLPILAAGKWKIIDFTYKINEIHNEEPEDEEED
jgi:hypothetical protein